MLIDTHEFEAEIVHCFQRQMYLNLPMLGQG